MRRNVIWEVIEAVIAFKLFFFLTCLHLSSPSWSYLKQTNLAKFCLFFVFLSLRLRNLTVLPIKTIKMSNCEWMQKVGEERKKEKSLERASLVGNTGSCQGCLCRGQIFKSLSQIIPRISGQRFLKCDGYQLHPTLSETIL